MFGAVAGDEHKQSCSSYLNNIGIPPSVYSSNIMDIYNKQPSEQSKNILNALKEAASNEIEKKRPLGQYVVLWKNDAIVYQGDDAPKQEKS